MPPIFSINIVRQPIIPIVFSKERSPLISLYRRYPSSRRAVSLNYKFMPESWQLVRRSGDNPIEEMTSGAVLDFEDPGVGVEAEFPREAFLDLCLRSGLLSVAPAEQPVRWMRVVEDALRRGPEQLRRAVESVQLHEDGPSFLSTAQPRMLPRYGSGECTRRPRWQTSGACQLLVHCACRAQAKYSPRARPGTR